MPPSQTKSDEIQQQIRQVVDSKCEFVLVLAPAAGTSEQVTIHFEPQLANMWLADASHKLKLPGKLPVLSNTEATEVHETQVQQVCAAVVKRVTEVIDVDAQNDLEDEDYEPSEYDSDDSSWGSGEEDE